ncbi:MAG: hypothetical protein WCY19_05150 [Candidatus Gastranaerophilaceae bacterium]
MISAKKANEQSAVNVLPVGLAKVEKQIKKAIKEGKNECFCAGLMAHIMINALIEAGYTVEQQIGRVKISW